MSSSQQQQPPPSASSSGGGGGGKGGGGGRGGRRRGGKGYRGRGGRGGGKDSSSAAAPSSASSSTEGQQQPQAKQQQQQQQQQEKHQQKQQQSQQQQQQQPKRQRNQRGGSGGGRGGGGDTASAEVGGDNKGVDNNNKNNSSGSGGGGGSSNNINRNKKQRNRRRLGGGGKVDKGSTSAKAALTEQQQQQQQQKQKEQKQQQQKQQSEEERKRQEQARREKEEQEAEEKRREEARRAAEAALESRRKERSEREKKLREAVESLRSAAEVANLHKSSREELSEPLLVASRKEFELNKKRLKTDLKKCTAFVKKVKSGSTWSMKPSDVARDVASLNLSRYVDEVVAAIQESKPKVIDLPVVAALCKAMHQRYADFLPTLLPGLWSVVTGKPEQAEQAKMRRLYIRLLTEFLLQGIMTETKAVVKCVAEATGGKDGSYAVQDANLVVAFSRTAGFEIYGVPPKSLRMALELVRRERSLCEEAAAADRGGTSEPVVSEASSTVTGDVDAVPCEALDGPVLVSKDMLAGAVDVADRVERALKERAVSAEVSQVLLTHCLGAYQTLSTTLVQTHGKLQKLEKRCEQDRLLSGSLTDAREKGLADARKLKESLQKSVEALSDVLDRSMPHLQEQEDDAGPEAGVGVEVWTKGSAGDGGNGENDFGPFDDEETRAFYCDILDLLTIVPPALLRMTPQDIEKRKAENLEKYGADADADADAAAAAAGEEAEAEADASPLDATPACEAQSDADIEKEYRDVSLGKMDEDAKDEDGGDEEEDREEEEENKDTPHYKLMVLLEQELPECHRREQIDELTEKFCTNHGSSKNSRKRLAKALIMVPRARLDLLPYYSRMAATLDRVWSDIAAPVVTELEQQFHGQAKYKKNQNLDSRFKTARYIGELTKFRVAPPLVFLRCLRRCLDDFSGSNVDVACCLLESAGRYLYRVPYTSARLTGLMEAMTRLSKAKNLDERLQSLIKAAFYSVKPPPSAPRKQAKEYPPLEAYLRHLLMVRLEPTDASVTFVKKQLIRFPWSDPSKQCAALVCRIMLKSCRKGRYKTIQAIAQVAADLRTQRLAGEVTVRLIDAVLEELRWALEHPNFRDQQRTITYARLLGELYCASQVAAQIILHQLYDFINLGHEIPDGLREASKKLAEQQQQQQQMNSASDSGLEGALQSGGRARTIAQTTIQEDEEMDGAAMEAEVDNTGGEEDGPQPSQPVAVSEHSRYDPRVPCLVDPPNSTYRIKLVCTLLEAVARSIVSRNNLPRIRGFLAAFQRYLFTKTMLPAEVEFSLLDTFDILDSQWRRLTKGSASSSNGNSNTAAASNRSSTEGGAGGGDDDNNNSSNKDAGFPRYESWIDAHNATIAVEESEALFEAQKKARLQGALVDSKSLAGMAGDEEDEEDGQSLLLNDDEETAGSMMMDEEEEDMLSAKDSVTDGNENGDDTDDSDASGDEDDLGPAGTSDDDDDDLDSEGGGGGGGDTDEDDEEDGPDEFDEEAYMRQLEEEAFERELRRVTMDALEKGKNASRKLVADYMPSGTQIIKKKPTTLAADPRATESSSTPPSYSAGGSATGSAPASGAGSSPQTPPVAMALGGKTGISFQLLKKGNKGRVEARELVVPVDTNLAMVATKQDDQAAQERDLIKQRVLQYEAESAEAEQSGGNVYLQQEKLQVIRNRPLSMEDIDRNFGTTGGNLLSAPGDGKAGRAGGAAGGVVVSQPHSASAGSAGSAGRGTGVAASAGVGRGGVVYAAGGGRGGGGGGRGFGGPGRGGRGRGRSSSGGRTLYR